MAGETYYGINTDYMGRGIDGSKPIEDIYFNSVTGKWEKKKKSSTPSPVPNPYGMSFQKTISGLGRTAKQTYDYWGNKISEYGKATAGVGGTTIPSTLPSTGGIPPSFPGNRIAAFTNENYGLPPTIPPTIPPTSPVVAGGGGIGATAPSKLPEAPTYTPATLTAATPFRAKPYEPTGINPVDTTPAIYKGLMTAGLSMLAQEPSKYPISFAQSLGKGGLAGMQEYTAEAERLKGEAGKAQEHQYRIDLANYSAMSEADRINYKQRIDEDLFKAQQEGDKNKYEYLLKMQTYTNAIERQANQPKEQAEIGLIMAQTINQLRDKQLTPTQETQLLTPEQKAYYKNLGIKVFDGMTWGDLKLIAESEQTVTGVDQFGVPFKTTTVKGIGIRGDITDIPKGYIDTGKTSQGKKVYVNPNLPQGHKEKYFTE